MDQSFKRKNLVPLIFLGFTLSLLPFPSGYASDDEVQDTNRLNLLRTATGQEPISDSFQARLDAILNPTPDLVKDSVLNEEARVANLLAPATDEELDSKKGAAIDSRFESDAEREKKRKDLAKVKDSGFVEAKADTSEAAYQQQVADAAQKAEEDQKKKLAEETKSADAEGKGETSPAAQSSLRPSLANNPFYFAPEGGKKFEEDKPVITGRLMQAGLSKSDAEELVAGATSPDEVVIALIQQKDYTYGEAADLVRNS